MKPIKFDPIEWEKLEDAGWTLAKIPPTFTGLVEKDDGTYIGQMAILGYVGQSLDKIPVPVIQLLDYTLQKSTCVYMIPPRKVLRYRRYLVKSVLDDIAVLSWTKDTAGYPDPSVYKNFIRWIDLEWQEEVL